MLRMLRKGLGSEARAECPAVRGAFVTETTNPDPPGATIPGRWPNSQCLKHPFFPDQPFCFFCFANRACPYVFEMCIYVGSRFCVYADWWHAFRCRAPDATSAMASTVHMPASSLPQHAFQHPNWTQRAWDMGELTTLQCASGEHPEIRRFWRNGVTVHCCSGLRTPLACRGCACGHVRAARRRCVICYGRMPCRLLPLAPAAPSPTLPTAPSPTLPTAAHFFGCCDKIDVAWSLSDFDLSESLRAAGVPPAVTPHVVLECSALPSPAPLQRSPPMCHALVVCQRSKELIDHNYVLRSASASFFDFTGYSPDALMGKNLKLLQGDATCRLATLQMRSKITEREPFKCDGIVNYSADGTAYNVSIMGMPCADPCEYQAVMYLVAAA